MKTGKLKEITGRFVKDSVERLLRNKAGCCSVEYGTIGEYRYCVCVGWHDTGESWAPAWKIGRQTLNNGMQCDFDVDFDMPYDEETGDVFDTLTLIEFPDGVAIKEWNAVASEIRKAALRVWKECKNVG